MSKKIQLNIGSRLGDLRKRKKMTLDELSSKSGVSKSIISQIERNISNPTISTVMRIAEALDETLSGFFMDIDTEKSSSIENSKETPVINMMFLGPSLVYKNVLHWTVSIHRTAWNFLCINGPFKTRFL